MKVVILAGGKGTRISEYTKILPKPMIKVGNKPILEHIIDYYIKFGLKDFIIASGYKHSIIKNYFNKKKYQSAKVKVINTGVETLTGSRLKKLSNELKETFMLTYGDGLSNINLKKLLNFHKKNKKMVTVTAVRPPARFGALKLKGDFVSRFKEKSKLDEGWINGGFFVMEPDFFKFIKNDNTYLEKQPLEKVTKKKQLVAFKHKKFWQCVDTKRDLDKIRKILKN